ncbi:RICIN domain-containing protein [Streptomyces sp. NPDC002287]
MSTEQEAATAGDPSTAEDAVICCWANVRSKLRMAVARESTRDGAEIHQELPASRPHQRWRLTVVGKDNDDVLYKIENDRSRKVLEVAADAAAGAVAVQRTYEGDDAHHQHWKLVPVGSESDSPRAYEIVNRKTGLFLRVDTNARAAIKQHGAEEGDPQGRQWHLLPV